MCIPVPAEGSVGTARGRRWRGGGCKERKMQPARLRSQGMSRRGCKARGMEPARASSEPVFIGCEARASSERVSVGQRKGNGAGASTQHAKALAMLPAQASSRTATSREGSRRAGGCARAVYIAGSRLCRDDAPGAPGGRGARGAPGGRGAPAATIATRPSRVRALPAHRRRRRNDRRRQRLSRTPKSMRRWAPWTCATSFCR